MRLLPAVVLFFVLSCADHDAAVTPPDSTPNAAVRASLHLHGSGFGIIDTSYILRPRSFTVECWVKLDTVHAGMIPFINVDGMDQRTMASGYGLKYESNLMYVRAALTDIDACSKGIPTPVTAGTWIHVCGSYDGSALRLYVNGELVGSVADSTPVYYGPEPLCIGVGYHSSFGGWNFLRGSIDELRIWDTARSQQEIAATMRSSLTGNEPHLVGYWNFDDNPFDDYVLDRGPGRNHILLFRDASIDTVNAF